MVAKGFQPSIPTSGEGEPEFSPLPILPPGIPPEQVAMFYFSLVNLRRATEELEKTIKAVRANVDSRRAKNQPPNSYSFCSLNVNNIPLFKYT